MEEVVFAKLNIKNPKRDNSSRIGRASWYPYYAGFSPYFAYSLLSSTELHRDACIVDPWNGSGTTTTVATRLGYYTQGYDLNPVMVIAAKACMLNRRDKSSLVPLTDNIINMAEVDNGYFSEESDPLCTWLYPSSVASLRKLERGIQHLLISSKDYQFLADRENINLISDITAFFYTALFRTVRHCLKNFFTSNPTWIKKPKDKSTRLQLNLVEIIKWFRSEVYTLISSMDDDLFDNSYHKGDGYIRMASSDSLPIKNESVDFVLASPPYCTRIDYAVATMPELAILGYKPEGKFQELRKKLIGTSTVPLNVPEPIEAWGKVCIEFLEKLESHKSKASKTYYYKNHVQYFDAIYRSLSELYRALKPKGICILVVQDSYYKDIHNNLPQIIIDMAKSYGLQLGRQENFGLSRTLAMINRGAKQYRQSFKVTESVLCFIKQ
jgi:DNA modification methylase